VRRARVEKYRSRAAFKLLQIQERYSILRKGQWILDMGAAPGGWSQVAAGISGGEGKVVAVDRLEIEPIPGVRIIRGDLMDEGTVARVVSALSGRKADLLLSDMAPNTTGIASVDHDRSAALVETVLDLVPDLVRPGGDVVVKIFQGRDFQTIRERLRRTFRSCRVCKPKASRSKSVEVYLLGIGFRF